MKQLRLVAAGLLPLLLGFLYSQLMQIIPWFPVSGWTRVVLPLLLLAAWGLLAFALAEPRKNPFLQALLMCAVGVVMLLVYYCYFPLRNHNPIPWIPFLNSCCQSYFLPWFSLAIDIVQLFSHPLYLSEIWPYFTAILVVLFVVSLIGCLAKHRKPLPAQASK